MLTVPSLCATAVVLLLRPTIIALVYNGRDRATGAFYGIADWRLMVVMLLLCYNTAQALVQPFKLSHESQLDTFSVLLLMALFL
eukprot:SAG11_NODE_10950_length_794_cov_0.579856_2_plen_84_part_00